mmetsp:Transcript_17581/g.40837  ORF Transcript_17581/g.40837 Transcript_17581/m.40837 type:complete len:98 (+) Transcript_17581:625-918(+)
MFGEIKPTFSLAGDEQIAARKALLLEGGGLAKQWAHIENQLKASTTPFLVGTKLTIADVVVFSMAAQLASGWLDGTGLTQPLACASSQSRRYSHAPL